MGSSLPEMEGNVIRLLLPAMLSFESGAALYDNVVILVEAIQPTKHHCVYIVTD